MKGLGGLAGLALLLFVALEVRAGNPNYSRSTTDDRPYEKVKPEHLKSCEKDEKEFQVQITRPQCLWECHKFEDLAEELYGHLEYIKDCKNSHFSRDDVDEMYEELMSNELYTCSAHDVFSEGTDAYYMCISSRAIMEITNTFFDQCEKPSKLKMPKDQEGVLKCTPDTTFPRRPTAAGQAMDGASVLPPAITDVKECAKTCTPDEREKLLGHLLSCIEDIKAALETVQWRLSEVETSAEQLKDEYKESDDKDVKKLLKTKYKYYEKRVKEHEKLEKAKEKELREVEKDLAYLQRFSRKAFTRTSIEDRDLAISSRKRNGGDEDKNTTSGCMKKGKACSGHYWASNVKINDECYNVCVHSTCQEGVTFLYCFVQSVVSGYTDPNCTADFVTREVCFDDLDLDL